MSRRRLHPGLALLAAGLAMPAWATPAQVEPPAIEPTAAAMPRALPFDPEHTKFGFQLRTRWGQRRRGNFPAYQGEVRRYPDGRRDVRLVLDSSRMQIAGHRRYTQWARGPEFFDAARFPTIEFVSETYDEEKLHEGGALHGTLLLRGISRPVRFVLEPATCDAPGTGCDVVASGEVERKDFGMDAWMVTVDNDVRFQMRVRTAEPEGR